MTVASEEPAVVADQSEPGHHIVIGKHQLAAAGATILDFAVMTLFTSGFGFRAFIATGFGAVAGGILSFSLGRTWIFRAADGHAGWQGARYMLVWCGSIALNMAGEYLLVQKLDVQYFLARVPVALAVGLLWNYPLHRYFVFPSGKSEAKRPR